METAGTDMDADILLDDGWEAGDLRDRVSQEIERLRLRKALLLERLAATQALASEREQRIADLRLALFIVPTPRPDDSPGSDRALNAASPEPVTTPEYLPADQVGAVRSPGALREAVLSGADQLIGVRPQQPAAQAPPIERTWKRELEGDVDDRPLWEQVDDVSILPWWARLRKRNRPTGG